METWHFICTCGFRFTVKQPINESSEPCQTCGGDGEVFTEIDKAIGLSFRGKVPCEDCKEKHLVSSEESGG